MRLYDDGDPELGSALIEVTGGDPGRFLGSRVSTDHLVDRPDKQQVWSDGTEDAREPLLPLTVKQVDPGRVGDHVQLFWFELHTGSDVKRSELAAQVSP